MDEKLEDLEKAEGRWERRDYAMQIKKENKIKRKEEIKRIRKLVDNAYNSDPRIKRFQKEELAKKEAEKKLLKKSRQALRKKVVDVCTEPVAQSLEAELHLICSQLEAVEMDNLRENLKSTDDIIAKNAEIIKNLNSTTQKQQEEINKRNEDLKKEKEWSVNDVQILVKAANMFPAGTTKRWEKLAAYVNDHSENEKSNKSAKECMQAFKKLHEKANDSKSAKG